MFASVDSAMPENDRRLVFDSLLRDLRFAVRSLRRTPVFALTAALVLGLGIGANTTVFTIVNTLLLRPLPFDRAGDLVIIGTSLTVGGRPYTVIGVAPDAVHAYSPAEMFLSLPVPEASNDRTNSFQVLARVAP